MNAWVWSLGPTAPGGNVQGGLARSTKSYIFGWVSMSSEHVTYGLTGCYPEGLSQQLQAASKQLLRASPVVDISAPPFKSGCRRSVGAGPAPPVPPPRQRSAAAASSLPFASFPLLFSLRLPQGGARERREGEEETQKGELLVRLLPSARLHRCPQWNEFVCVFDFGGTVEWVHSAGCHSSGEFPTGGSGRGLPSGGFARRVCV